ncbi:MAG: type II secretion system protein [Blastopirellula sp. JB062]
MKTRAHVTRRGFTLVELLVVITIIGILAGLALVAIPQAVGRVKEGAITAELAQIEAAVNQFKNDHGAYPPDLNAAYYPADTDRQGAISSFLRKTSPRIAAADYAVEYDPSDSDELAVIQTLELAGIVSPNAAAGTIVDGVLKLDRIGPAEALVVFLSGFSSDVERPFTGEGDRKRYFDFKVERLQDLDNDGWLEYYPSGVEAPYIYFNSRSYVNGSAVARFPFDPSGSAFSDVGQARPYFQVLGSTSGFANPKSFQIICAGIDGHFGDYSSDYAGSPNASAFKIYPSGLDNSSFSDSIPYTTDDRDNITNFAQGPLRNKEPE